MTPTPLLADPQHVPADPMSKPLRVLVVEDSESDTLVLLRELRKAGYAPEHERVDNAAAMKAALPRAEWDVVLSGYRIAGFGGPEALEIVKQSGRDIPFILVSGAIGEAAAVNMMKAGAHDFVMKGSLDRLEPVLKRELADAAARHSVITQKQKRDKLEKALRESRDYHVAARAALENHYKTLIQNAPDTVLLFDGSGDIIEANVAAAIAYGYEAGELLRKNIRDLRAAEAMDDLNGDWKAAGEPGGTRFETLHRRKDGSVFPVEVTSKLIEVAGRTFRQSFVRDISARIQAEAARQSAEEKFRGLVEQSMMGVFMVDATSVRYANPRMEEIFGYAPGALVGRAIRDLVADEDLRAVLRELERVRNREAKVGRVDFRGRHKSGKNVMVGAVGTLAALAGESVVIGAVQDITDKWQAEQRARDYMARLERAMLGTVGAISRMMDMRDPYTSGHEHRVGEISAAIAAEMGLGADLQHGLRVAGGVHDVGKITVPAEILSKPGKLSAMEFDLVKSHAAQGYEVLKDIDFPWPVAEVARQHHERWDGSGYPRGLKGEQIILEARIVAVADVVEAMSSHRPYRPGLGIKKALAEIERGRGTAYDPQAADACLRLFRGKGYAIPA